VSIHLHKRVPAAAGLGGGASDAAAVIRALAAAWEVPAPAARAAEAVGSDVPFFLSGGTARARGRGETVTPLADLPRHGVVLFIPPTTLELKTATLFRALAELPFDGTGEVEALARALPRQLTSADILNSFERVAFDVFPGLGALRAAVEARLGAPPRLAGAGPVLFWIGPPEQRAAVVSRARGLGCRVLSTATASTAALPSASPPVSRP
jgi:4-diphosphocytidyl-2-C-methyl-D-erythritol kinase